MDKTKNKAELKAMLGFKNIDSKKQKKLAFGVKAANRDKAKVKKIIKKR
jgi:hypothetical protein